MTNILLAALTAWALRCSAQQAEPGPLPPVAADAGAPTIPAYGAATRHLLAAITRQPEDYRQVKTRAEAKMDKLVAALNAQRKYDPKPFTDAVDEVRRLMAGAEVGNQRRLGIWVEVLKKAVPLGYDYEELKARAVYTYMTRQEFIWGNLYLQAVNESLDEVGRAIPLTDLPMPLELSLQTFCKQSRPPTIELMQLIDQLDPPPADGKMLPGVCDSVQ
jgi:hypothetical protein